MIVDELVRNDVRHVVLSPGSRNAALAMALHDAAEAGTLTLHVRIDERVAGFLALGLSRGGGRPAAVVCTSGTAAANLHPAVLEAYHSGVGLLAITADRPPELHGTGANQTIDQRGLFGPAAVAVEFPVAERREGQNQVWRGLVCRAVAQAEHGRPVQVNVPFREPLVPTFEPRWPELARRPAGRAALDDVRRAGDDGRQPGRLPAARAHADGRRQRPGRSRASRPRPSRRRRAGRRSPSRPGWPRRCPAARRCCAAARCCCRWASCHPRCARTRWSWSGGPRCPAACAG